MEAEGNKSTSLDPVCDYAATGTENFSLDDPEEARDGGATGGRVIIKQRGGADAADSADPADSRNAGAGDPADSTDQSGGDTSNGGESDSDSTSEGTCLGAMTPSGQEYYLRLGDTPRRRSALRLSRIIARQQLLRRLQQGRDGELWHRNDDLSL